MITLTERVRSADGGFEVAVGFEGGGEHLVTVADPLAGNPDGERLLAWYFEEHLRYPFLDRDREQEAVLLLADYGSGLFAQVFEASSDCLYEFRRVRDAGLDGFQLQVVGGLDFHRLHWESLRDSGVGAPLGARVPIVRKVGRVAAGFDVPDQGHVLRVLVVTARPDGARDVGYRTISRPLLAALRRARIPVSVDLVRPGSWRALERHLQATTSRRGSGWYGIVHFDVHGWVADAEALAGTQAGGYLLAEGTPPNGNGGDAFLSFETSEEGAADPVPTARVAGLLVEHRVPVAVLNACQSAMPVGVSEASLAQRLVQAGVPVALGMAYSVTVSAAELMMPVIYEQLAGGAELISAIHTGRRRLFDERRRRVYFDQDLDLEDWVLPVVFAQRPVHLQPLPETPEQQQDRLRRQAWRVDEPGPTYGFVGRDLDVQRIERLLLGEGGHNELLVGGMAGAGKSTLLAHLGWWWQITGLVERIFSFSYEHRAWTVSEILHTIITALLEGPDQARALGLTDEAQLEHVAEKLRIDRHLLVLDNAESITASPASIPHSLPEEERARLGRFLSRLRGGKTLVLIGSREPEQWLANNAFKSNTYELGGLDPQAASVLVDHIIAQDHGRLPDSEVERDALEDLISVVGGYPMALTAVLPALASTPPSAVLAELKGGGAGVDPSKIIQCAVQYSYDRLEPTIQHSLTAFAPFTGVVPIIALDLYGELLAQHEPVRSLGALDLLGALNEAVRVGLATPDTQLQNHIRVHPLLPYFLRARLADSPTLAAAITRAHHDLYAQRGSLFYVLLTSREPDERAAGKALTGAEYANLTAALDHALAEGDSVIPFIGSLDEYLDQTHQQHPRRQLLERVIDALSQSSADRRAELAALHNLAGITAVEQHRLDDAHTHHKVELALLEMLKDRHDAASTYHQLGRVAEQQGRLEEAEDYFKKALEIKLEFKDRHSAASTYHQLGVVAEKQRRLEEAEDYYRKALEIKLEFKDRHSAASTYHQLGMVVEKQGRFEEAEVYYRKALELFIEFKDRHSAASTQGQRGGVAERQRHFEEAEVYYKEALELFIEFKDRHSAAIIYHQLGVVVEKQGRFEEAEVYYRKALELFIEFKDRHSAASTQGQRGGVAERQRRFEEAEVYYKEALELFIEFKDRHSAAIVQGRLGVLLTQLDRVSEAIPFSLRALLTRLEESKQWSDFDLQWLKRQRRLIGADAFKTEVMRHSDERVFNALVPLLDQISEPPDNER
jgi:tetratricopeptide (TPR) repeat protein